MIKKIFFVSCFFLCGDLSSQEEVELDESVPGIDEHIEDIVVGVCSNDLVLNCYEGASRSACISTSNAVEKSCKTIISRELSDVDKAVDEDLWVPITDEMIFETTNCVLDAIASELKLSSEEVNMCLNSGI